MSGFLLIDNFNCMRSACPLFVEVTLVSGTMVVVDYYPIIITVVFFLFSLYQREFYLFLLGWAATMDLGLNTALQWIIKEPGPYYAMGCGTSHEMPSFATQQACMLIAMTYTFVVLHRVNSPARKLFFLYFFLYAAIVARIYLGINTRLQLLIGALVGTAEGLIYHLILAYAIFPYSERIVRFFNDSLGMCMVDSFVNVKAADAQLQRANEVQQEQNQQILRFSPSPSMQLPVGPDPPQQYQLSSTAASGNSLQQRRPVYVYRPVGM